MGKELRVLILDESAEFTAALVGELRSAGYIPVPHHVVSIESLSFALDDAAWDLVIGDYSMPSFMPAGALEHFVLDGQAYHGHKVTLRWDRKRPETERFEVWIDGKRVGAAGELKRMFFDLKTGKRLEKAPAGE